MENDDDDGGSENEKEEENRIRKFQFVDWCQNFFFSLESVYSLQLALDLILKTGTRHKCENICFIIQPNMSLIFKTKKQNQTILNSKSFD